MPEFDDVRIKRNTASGEDYFKRQAQTIGACTHHCKSGRLG